MSIFERLLGVHDNNQRLKDLFKLSKWYIILKHLPKPPNTYKNNILKRKKY